MVLKKKFGSTQFFKTSAKTGENVDILFHELTTQVYNRLKPQLVPASTMTTLT
jgi:hypothetical protein